jgi:splicing factor 3A subunit 1
MDPAENGAPNGNGDVEMDNPSTFTRFATGVILPPPEIKCKARFLIIILVHKSDYLLLPIAVIDRTASYVGKTADPALFEDKIREGQRSDPKFSFLNPMDPYHMYYRDKLDRIMQGDVEEDLGGGKVVKDGVDAAQETKKVDLGVEPPSAAFILDMPNISPIDL